MDTDWITDVLGDLRVFARDNDLPRLARQLSETLTVAERELNERRKGTRLRVVEDNGRDAGELSREARASTDA